ncbi:DNA mismatch repair protein MutS [Rhodobacteraceae bacterium IMCC1933]|nr:DNA mismatch repair protein MutS [Rhodobacteraceae bacterium IMCC1923]MDP4066677.1 DNA mismatch repair protein MutS [Rhodobacteraceae bacterium IMCC1933]MDP4072257.1 DNA mismatch repair protein MutS [Rhodobacteraceae bacterium IMCC1909]
MSKPDQSVTPMMAQFLEIKEEYPSALLFYRMGDFYELFFDDAVAAAQALDITLTKRGKHQGADIPMCGVPVHAAEGYLLNLIRKGFRVAVCEQLENPKEAKNRGAKSVVKRGVVRLVTPGTLTEDTLLQPRQSNFLATFVQVRNQSCLAWVDISTGDMRFSPCPPVRLGPELARLAPAEVLVAEGALDETLEIIREAGAAATELPQEVFDSTAGVEKICKAYGVSDLSDLGEFSRADVAAVSGLIKYLSTTQKGQLPLLRRPVCEARDDFVAIDAATRKNLELTQTLAGERSGSLLSVVDRSVTAAGARLLSRRITTPSQRLATIDERASVVEFFCGQSGLRGAVRTALKQLPDVERALGRVALERNGPRDFLALGNGIAQAAQVHALLAEQELPPLLKNAADDLKGFEALSDELDRALVAEPPLLARDGGFVAASYSVELDEMTALRDEARSVIARMQADYAAQSEISSLKIKHNNVLGYFIETTATHAQRMMTAPLSDVFIHRQTTANAVRFTTVELGELETKILNAAGRATELELEVFAGLCALVLDSAAALQALAVSIAEIDVAAALSELAMAEGWVRPMLNDSRDFIIEQGRHPVVEAAIKAQAETVFVANDCQLTSTKDMIWLLTGPNMAGKSTFLRQNALIALLAQAGSFVPAARAEIGIVSQIFSRVGAADDLARGRSTFMVEMVETAAILNQADDRALVILDEIGRGTSTYDGLSIAWATLEHLHDVNRCRALFATHYHELTQLTTKLTHVDNATVTVREYQGDVVFLHEVKKGAADRSYGVQVAKLAGLPQSVLERAKMVLEALEQGEREGHSKQKALIDDLPLFSAVAMSAPAPSAQSELEEVLNGVQPDSLSPKEALDLIYELKSKLKT